MKYWTLLIPITLICFSCNKKHEEQFFENEFFVKNKFYRDISDSTVIYKFTTNDNYSFELVDYINNGFFVFNYKQNYRDTHYCPVK